MGEQIRTYIRLANTVDDATLEALSEGLFEKLIHTEEVLDDSDIFDLSRTINKLMPKAFEIRVINGLFDFTRDKMKDYVSRTVTEINDQNRALVAVYFSEETKGFPQPELDIKLIECINKRKLKN